MLPESDGSAVNGSVSQNQTNTIGGRDGRPDREPGHQGINRRSFLRAAGVSVIGGVLPHAHQIRQMIPQSNRREPTRKVRRGKTAGLPQ